MLFNQENLLVHRYKYLVLQWLFFTTKAAWSTSKVVNGTALELEFIIVW